MFIIVRPATFLPKRPTPRPLLICVRFHRPVLGYYKCALVGMGGAKSPLLAARHHTITADLRHFAQKDFSIFDGRLSRALAGLHFPLSYFDLRTRATIFSSAGAARSMTFHDAEEKS